MEEENNEYLKLPVEDRCQHKLWKARVSGYEDATKLFQQQVDEKSPEFNKYLGLLKKFVIDSHAMAQEKGITAVIAYVEIAACAGRTCSDVISGIVAKGLAAPRTKTRELSLELILKYVEIEKQEVVEEELIKGLENKSPKVVSACVIALRESLHCFGSQVITIKPLAKVLPKLLEDRDKNVRDESKLLCAEIYRWVGDAIKPQLQNLKPVSLTELESEFQKVRGDRPVPTHYLRSQQEKLAKCNVEEKVGSAEDEGEEYVAPAIDPYDLMTEVNILSKLPNNFYEQCEAKKWQERKEALESLLQLSTDVKLESGDYGELVKTIKKIIAKDTNVLVVTLACKCLTNLIRGLRKKFQPYYAPCVPVILEKFKEKKQTVVQALRDAIDAIINVTTLENILEDIQAALNNKNPQIKAETAAFLTRCFSGNPAAQLTKKLLKPLCSSLIKTLNDTDATVRDNSAEALGTALKVVGEKVMIPFIQEIDALKMTKVKDCCEKAVITTKPQAPERKPAATTVKSASSTDIKPANQNTKLTRPIKKPSSAPVVKGKMHSGSSNIKMSSSKKGGGDSLEPAFVETDLSEEDVITQASTILPDEVMKGLNSSIWKERLVAAEKFFEVVQQADKTTIPAQALIKVLAKKPGFKENNFQILKLRFEILTYIADNAPISHCTIDSCLSDIVDKIGDVKNGSSAGAALSSLAAATSLEFISLEVLNLAFTQKNPRNQAEALIWLSTAVKQFGLKIQIKEVIDCLKKAFSSTNPMVKTAALTLVSTLYMYVGKAIRTFFEEEKPALLQLIDAELEKVQDVKPPLPERGLTAKNHACGGDMLKSGAQVNIVDLIPRVDISPQITSNIITELSDKDWHLRLEALQKISNIVNDAKYITPNLGDLPTALKPRLTDTNIKLSLQALSICQMLGTALGPHSSKQLRNFSPEILAALGNSKPAVRTAAIQCLNSWMEECPLSSLFEGEVISDALRTENPFLRIELFSWLTESLPKTSSVPLSDLNVCVPILLNCLEDRNSDVRKKASECLFPVTVHVGYEIMVRAASKLKPASKNNVMSQLEKIRPSLPEKVTKTKQQKTPFTISDRGSPPPSSGAVEAAEEQSAAGANKGRLVKSNSKFKLASKAHPSVKTKKEEEVDTSPPLVVNNLKDQRLMDEKSLKVLRWNFTSPREEFYLQLKEQMLAACWGRTLISHCFHNDFKFHIKAIDIFIETLSNIEATAANLDLILKWLALRFFDTNPSVLIKALEYLQMLFELLIGQRYRLLEAEASSFVPYLILKIGDPKDSVRKGVKEIIKLICKVYPSSKMFSFIMQGLTSKNARQRAECLDELGVMIELYGLSVCQPSPAVALKEIARQISDRDNAVRNAALNCVVNAYLIDGEKVYKYVGQLADKYMSLLEERIKRTSKVKTIREAREAMTCSAVPVVQAKQVNLPAASTVVEEAKNSESEIDKIKRLFAQDIDDIEQKFKSKKDNKIPELVPVNADEILNLPDIHLPQTSLRPPASALKILNNSSEAVTAVNLVMAQLTEQEIPVVVEAFAQIEELLRQDERAEALMGSRVDQLLVMGALQYRLAHNTHMTNENICKADVIRLYRCVTMALIALFDHPTLPKRASRDVLRELIPHLITLLLDNRLNELQEGPQVVRTINVFIIRMLQKSNPTHIMSALIKVLHDCAGSVNASDRYTDLIMKCLWKMIRLIRQCVDELNVDRILLDLHVFLKAFPSSSWKERQVDTPIRTIKTIVYTLVDILGDDIMKHLVLIQNRQESDLYSYIQRILKMKKDEGRKLKSAKHAVQDENAENKETYKKNKSSLKLSKSTHEALTEIFKKIGSKEQTKEGLVELYEFTNQHPEANIEPFLQRSSEFFQNYIRQGIQKIAQEKKSRQHQDFGPSPIINSPDVVPKTADFIGNQNMWNNCENNDNDADCNDNKKVFPQSWQYDFPPMPPATVDTTPVDWAEWLKAVVARLGLDSSKYDDPAVLEKIVGPITNAITENDRLMTEQELAEFCQSIEQMKQEVEDIKNKYHCNANI